MELRMKKLIDQLRRLFTPQEKRKFLFIALMMTFSALLELAGLGVLLGAATLFLAPDSAAGSQVPELLHHLFPGFSPEYRAAAAVGTIGVMLAGKNLLALLIVHIQSKFIFNKRNQIAHRLYDTLLHGDFESVSKLSQDYCFGLFTRLNEVANLVFLPSIQLVADVMVIFILAAASIIMFPKITIPGIIFMVIISAVVQFFTRRANLRNGEKLFAAGIEENRARLLGIAGNKTIKCAAKEEFFQQKFDNSYAKTSFFSRKLYTLGQLPRLALESASILLASGVFVIMVVSGTAKMEILLTFAVLTAAIGRILPAMSRGYYNLTLIRQYAPLVDDICRILMELPQEKDVANGVPDAAGDIVFKDVTFAYNNGEKIFDHFNLTIAPCSSLAISGKSGRGKSTLMDLLMGLLKPENGSITAGGMDISGNLAGWRKQIGIVPQNIFLQEGTVAENVAFGEENIDLSKVSSALALAGLSDFAPEFELTAQGNLSGGQRQRIGIARALYKESKLLILDEATSALDTETENAFCEVLNSLRGKVTLIVISHRESTLNACDKLLRL